MNKNQIFPVILGGIVIASAAFYGGMQYQKIQKGGQFVMGNGQFRGIGGQGAQGQIMTARSINGEIISSDDKSITVKLTDGSSKIILLNDQSSISEATSSGRQALMTGKNVLVFGITNQDGSMTAQNIQLNPQGGMMFGQNRPPDQNR